MLTPERIAVVRPQEVLPLSVGAANAARIVGVCEKTIRSLADSGELPSLRIGNRLLFRVATLDRWLAERESSTAVALPINQGAP